MRGNRRASLLRASRRVRAASTAARLNERRGSLGGILDTAALAYAPDWPFYALLSAGVLAAQLVAVAIAGPSPDLLVLAQLVIDAYAAAVVSIGVTARIRGESLTYREMLARALRRYGDVFIVDLIGQILHDTTAVAVIGTPEQSGYFLFALPTLVLWGAFLPADVIAAVETPGFPLGAALPAILRAVLLTLRGPNLGRTLAVGALFVIPVFLEVMLGDWLTARHAPGALVWSAVPLDALFLTPVQALAAAFYADLLASETA